MKPPTNLPLMTTRIFLQVRPLVHQYLNEWRHKAMAIPDPELRRQALMSITTKTFHCEGGAIYGLLAGEHYRQAIRFIVAYQTISDYLDNLCDRSTSLDAEDFRALHESMPQALTPDMATSAYYRHRKEQDDGGYLVSLIKTCQDSLRELPAYSRISPALHELAQYYCDLQIHKHVAESARVPLLKDWFDAHRDHLPPMSWYEFAACAGSTLGIFCLMAHAFSDDCTDALVRKMKEAYFPWVQGLHILLDYFIDQEEDRTGGDLNFCAYYPTEAALTSRLAHFYRQAERSIIALPHAQFHRLITRGLLGIYLADRKMDQQKPLRRLAKQMLDLGGMASWFFFFHCWVYRRLSQAKGQAVAL